MDPKFIRVSQIGPNCFPTVMCFPTRKENDVLPGGAGLIFCENEPKRHAVDWCLTHVTGVLPCSFFIVLVCAMFRMCFRVLTLSRSYFDPGGKTRGGCNFLLFEGPKVGGDTLFSDMHLAYEGLPDEFKERLEGAIAVHDFAGFRKRLEQDGKTPSEIEALNKKFPCPEHPVIRTHPDTKQKVIYVNKAFTKFIKGWDKDESSAMLDFLYSQAAIPEYQCRFIWEKDSIAFWDNRACQHYAVSDYWPQVRRVERVTVIGDRPY